MAAQPAAMAGSRLPGDEAMKRTKRRRWLRRIFLGVLGVTLASLCGGWLALRHVPSWYSPATVRPARLQEVRDSLTAKFREISDRMVRKNQFEVAFDDRMVTEWVVARGEIWPDAEEWIPSWLRDPVVVFSPDRITLAAHLDRDGWEAIVGIHFSARVEDQDVVLQLENVTTGALPIPLSALGQPLDRLIHSQRLDVELMPDELAVAVRRLRREPALEYLEEGIRYDRPLIWKNGDRPYRITDIRVEDGLMVLSIQPL